MGKTLKKLLSSVIAFSMAASLVAAPAVVKASSGMIYLDGKLTVTSDKSCENVTVYVASYNADGTLKAVKLTPVEGGLVANEEKSIDVSAAVGDKIMLWSNDNNTAIADAVEIEAETPTEEPNDIIQSWRFDFGSAENVDDGYYAVTKDTHYNSNIVDGLQFGLLGTNENDYKLEAYVDGIEQQEGQVIVLKEGSKDTVESASDDFIGNAPQEEANYKVPGVYPVRFSMKGVNDNYYRVSVELTTLDQTQDAVATVTSERRRAIILEETIPAGETKTVEFTATPQNNYYKGPAITYQDNVLNVVAMGDNLAVSQIIVNEVTPKTTVWMYDDSTGCDYNAILPYFPLQNYGGTGQFMSKYLPVNIAVSNQGEGGLNAADNMHWGCANGHIGAGDYVYVQYGHNHKDGGVLEYLQCIPKYYEYASSVGAYTIFAGPIDRHNASQYDAATNTWSSTLSGFSKAAKYYTELLITGGKAKADEFIQKAKAAATGTGIEASVYEWADEVIAAGITEDGVKDVAFIDLNQPTLDWLEQVCEDVKAIRGSESYERSATDYYFRVAKGTSVDGTHPNDAGADNTASFFFDEAKKVIADTDNEVSAVQADILAPLVTDMREATPYVVSEEIITAGGAGGAGWPDLYVPDNLPDLPTEIKSVTFNEDGTVASVVVETRDADLEMGAYGIVEITINNSDGTEKGKLYAVDQIDNTVIGGTQTVTAFRGDVTLGADDTYTAMVWKAVDSDSGLIVDEEMVAYSAVYVPTDIETHLITDEDGNGTEDFYYYGAIYQGDELSELSSFNDWSIQGSAGKDLTLGVDGDIYYANVISDGAKGGSANQGSFYLAKQLESEIGTAGKYMVEMDMQYVSGGGAVFRLANGFSDKSPFITETLELFKVNSNGILTIDGQEAGGINTGTWSTVRYILDMDYGKASLSVSGGTPVEIDVENYQTNSTDVNPAKLTHFVIDENKAAVGIRIANLTVAKLKSDKLPEYTITLNSINDEYGTATSGASTAVRNTAVTVVAQPNDGYVFTGWTDAQGTLVSKEASYSFRINQDIELTANFDKQSGIDGVASYVITPGLSTLKIGDSTNINLSDVVDENGNPIETTIEDVELSCETEGVTIENGVITINENFAISDNSKINITVKGILNNIEKTCIITVHSYLYYEKMSEATSYTGRLMEIGDKEAIVFGGSKENHTYTLTNNVDLSSPTKITFSQAWTGSNTCGQNRTLNFKDANDNTILSMYYTWGDLVVNGSTLSGAVLKDTWTDVVIEIDGTTATVTAGASSVTATVSGSSLASIEFNAANSVPAERLLGISEITIQSN